MRQTATRHLLNYWDGLREGRATPAPAIVRASAERETQRASAFASMRATLADTFLLDVDPERAFPICAAGGRLDQLLLSPGFGTSFVAQWREEQREEVANLLCFVCDEFSPAVASVWAAPQGAASLAFEMLLLPLRRGPGHATLLGGLSPSAVPDWYGREPVAPMRLAGWRMLHRSERVAAYGTARERLALIQGGRMDVEAPV